FQKTYRGRFVVTPLAQFKSVGGSNLQDDHNSPNVDLDPRPDAIYPLTIRQADHAVAPARLWRARLPDIGALGPEQEAPFPQAEVTYGQTFRRPSNPDEAWHFFRDGFQNPGTWFIAKTTDNGATWQVGSFWTEQATYAMGRLALDGTGVHL